MADTQRTRAAILSLFADNVTGQISAQDLRDFVVTLMESEFANPGDYWKDPDPRFTLTDKTIRGWIDYSQEVGSDVVFMDVVYKTITSGVWKRALVSASAQNAALMGVMADSYNSGVTTAQVLRRGVIRNTALSTIWSNCIGRLVYLASSVAGSCSITATTNSQKLLGYVLGSDGNDNGGAVWYFNPEWSIKGV